MNDLFNEYISRRLGDIDLNKIDKIKKGSEAVITISRAAGCQSLNIANLLAKRLNVHKPDKEWEVISKELLHSSVDELQHRSSVVEKAFIAKNRSFLDDIVHAFTLSPDYYMDQRIRKTLVNVVRRFAYDGHKIILGRAGNIICADMKNCLHIRVDANINWRIEQVMQLDHVSKEEAIAQIAETEKKRQSFIRSIKGRLAHVDDYDMVVNQETFSDEQIVDLIEKALKVKRLQ